jgi:hypothetical protein
LLAEYSFAGIDKPHRYLDVSTDAGLAAESTVGFADRGGDRSRTRQNDETVGTTGPLRAEAQGDDGEPFEEKMKRLTAKLEEQFAESPNLDQAIRENLKSLGYGE